MTSNSILSNLARTVKMALLTTAALTVTTPAFAQSNFFSDWHSSQNFSVEFNGQKLSVTGNNIPLKELMLEIQEQTGIKVNLVANPGDRVTLNVEEQSVESVISQISDNHMIIHSNVNGIKTVSELVIISDGNEDISTTAETSEFLPTGEPTPLIAAAMPELTDEKADQNL